LQNAVAERQHRQRLRLRREGEGAEAEVEGQAEQPDQEPAQRRLNVPRAGQAVEQVRQAVEGARVEHGQHDHEDGQKRVGDQLEGDLEGQGGGDRRGQGEQGRPAEDQAEGAVGDDAGQGGGDDDLRLEVGRAVQHLGGEQGAGQRGAEDGRHAGAHARRH
jgi:hypothetical protein